MRFGNNLVLSTEDFFLKNLSNFSGIKSFNFFLEKCVLRWGWYQYRDRYPISGTTICFVWASNIGYPIPWLKVSGVGIEDEDWVEVLGIQYHENDSIPNPWYFVN